MEANLYAVWRGHVLQILAELAPGIDAEALAKVEVTPARDPRHGDLTTNAALVLTRARGEKPIAFAERLAALLGSLPDIAQAKAAGPGFVNLRLAASAWRAQVGTVLAAGDAYGDSLIGGGKRVNVEYVSANPTGPMHIGHCRGAVVGDALAALLAKAGYEVTREYYINDAGAQVEALVWAAYWRYLQAIGTTLSEAEFDSRAPGGLQYRGEYLIALGEELKARFGTALATPEGGIADPPLWQGVVREAVLAAMMAAVREDLAALGVRHDVFTSERALIAGGAVERAVSVLEAEGLIYEGVLDPPKGKSMEDWEPRAQTLFAARRFGDEIDRPLKKSDGSSTYFANDIGYHADKIARGAEILIDVWGADHGGYVARMQAAVQALSGGKVPLEIVLCQIVHVVRAGQPVRMSKRSGTYVTLRDLIEEVGRDAVRFTMLMRKPDAQMHFDLDAVMVQNRENPVFYVQYAHARARSVLRAAVALLGAERLSERSLAQGSFDPLIDEAELGLIRRLAQWPRLVEAAAQAREPHRIAFFLYDLAGDFHILWNKGRDDATLRFLQPDHPAETLARCGLVAATAVVLRSGLAILGVTPVEEMR